MLLSTLLPTLLPGLLPVLLAARNGAASSRRTAPHTLFPARRSVPAGARRPLYAYPPALDRPVRATAITMAAPARVAPRRPPPRLFPASLVGTAQVRLKPTLAPLAATRLLRSPLIQLPLQPVALLEERNVLPLLVFHRHPSRGSRCSAAEL